MMEHVLNCYVIMAFLVGIAVGYYGYNSNQYYGGYPPYGHTHSNSLSGNDLRLLASYLKTK